MCISKPQLVLDYSDGFATVEFLGKKKEVKSFKPLKPGEYVLSQANVVVQKLPKEQAEEMLKEWRELNQWK
jgi:hydrogenase maturation factor